MIKSLLCLSIAILFSNNVAAQILGSVTDENGNPLPYVNIYVKSTTTGTTTNFNGEYSIKLEKGNYEIVYQYVGYSATNKNIDYNGVSQVINVQLLPQVYELNDIVINANAEDPAYAIIRNAQVKRKYYRDKMDHYECDAYVKGFNKVLDAPEKILGQDVGDMDGALDSTRQGVVYLSESVSKLYYKNGKSKEILYSSKVSGDDNGYSFNSAQEMYFNFYDKNIDLNTKNLISPISPSALSYYDYQLEGTQYDNSGQLINKIKVIPKNDFSPTFYGYIYINEDLWNINSIELGVTSKSLNLSLVDSLVFKQIFIPVIDDQWMPLSNVIKFKLGAFGFKLEGNFACVYSDYILNNVDDNIFSREVFRVEKEANNRTATYWDSLRPIPLTKEERIDYKRKDSIQIVRTSPEYLDSIDRVNNKYKLSYVLNGYRHQNSQKKSSYSLPGLLPSLGYNTIQGLALGLGSSYRKSYDEEANRRLSITANADYGFSEKVIRPNFSLFYRANNTNRLNFTISGGRTLNQYNRNNPITKRLNTIMSLFVRRNYLKAYDKNFASLRIGRFLGPILSGNLSLDYEDRSAVTNNTDYSFYYRDSRTLLSNNPLSLANDSPAFEDHQALILRAGLRINIGQEIWSYPDQTFRVGGSDWPTIWINYKKAIPALGGDVDYDLLYATISKSYRIGVLGSLSGYIRAGTFLNSNNVEFIDHYHFTGNQTHIGDPSRYRNQFLLLPYYAFSSNDNFVEAHFQHSFNGAILSKLPVLKKLGWELSAGGKLLKSSDQDLYTEYHLGVGNIGVKLLRLFRVDFVWSNQDCDLLGICNQNRSRFGLVVGIATGI